MDFGNVRTWLIIFLTWVWQIIISEAKKFFEGRFRPFVKIHLLTPTWDPIERTLTQIIYSVTKPFTRQLCAVLDVGCDVLQWIKEKSQKQGITVERYTEAVTQVQKQEKDLISNLRQEKEDALSRLCELMSLKLRDGNPNVVDLSDEYRPTKLAELSGELYDNEWTNAYEFLETNTELSNGSERQHIQFLLDVLLETFEFCTKTCTDEWKILVSKIRGDNVVIKKEEKKLLKDLRKKYATERLQDIDKKCLDQLELRCQGHSYFRSEPIVQFVQGCVKLCWLMQFQDPPVVLRVPSGKAAFIYQWPVLYL